MIIVQPSYRVFAIPVITTGYFAGGYNGTTGVGDIDGIVFASETATNPSVTLTVARYYLTGVNSSTRGYFGGGSINGVGQQTEIDGIRFDTEASINPAAVLSVARGMFAGVQSSGLL